MPTAASSRRSSAAEDAVISDALNHASIIDGIRLCKAQRHRYAHNDMADLEAKLQAASGARYRLIATDGAFSMDGTIADLGAICDLADKYDALVMVDDCHAAGFLGKTGRGTHEHCGVMGRVDIITGTLGKALGGASGGYTSARKPVVDLLRQRSRPYLFSNSVAPCVVAASLKAIEMVSASTELRDRLEENTRFFREDIVKIGLTIKPGTHPIVPIMLGDAALSQRFAARMLEKGVYVVGFFYPVVPEGTARIRTQVSAAHTREDLDFAIRAFAEVKAELGFKAGWRSASGGRRGRRTHLTVRTPPSLRFSFCPCVLCVKIPAPAHNSASQLAPASAIPPLPDSLHGNHRSRRGLRSHQFRQCLPHRRTRRPLGARGYRPARFRLENPRRRRRRFGHDSRPEAIFLTHGHFDHAGNASALSDLWGVPIYAHPMELPYLTGRSDYPPPDPTVGGAIAMMSRVLPHGGQTSAPGCAPIRSRRRDDGGVRCPVWTAGAGSSRRGIRRGTWPFSGTPTAPCSRATPLRR